MKRLFIILCAIFMATSASADAGSGIWTSNGSSPTTTVSAGKRAYFQFAAGASNSKLIYVSANSYVCFDTDIASATVGAARITIRLAIASAGTDVSSVSIASPAFNTTDCRDIRVGSYWINIVTQPAGSEVARVMIQGS
jgi:hypothetical protein|tara:strand:+ start:348 stop:764 length:417 start_codon:yes stop_codon:yes gene_type:complete